MSVLNALCGPLIICGPLTFGPIEREEKRERRGEKRQSNRREHKIDWLCKNVDLVEKYQSKRGKRKGENVSIE